MTVLSRTFAVVLAATLAVPARADAAGSLPPLRSDRLAAAIAGLPDDQVSAALAQVRGSAGEWSGSAGITSLRDPEPPRAGSRFRIGSITKVFTAVVVLQ